MSYPFQSLKEQLFHPDPQTRRQFLRYLTVGFSSFALEYSLYVLLFRGFGLYYILASTIVYAVVFAFVFLMNRNWSFQSTGSVRRQLAQYGTLFLFNLVFANVVLMYLFTDILGISPFISPILKMSCVVCWNFMIYKYIIYK